MNIAFVLPSLANTGPVLVARDIIERLPSTYSQVDVYYFGTSSEEKFSNPRVTIRRVSFWSMVDFSKYDVVHSHCIWGDLYLAKTRKSKNVKFISTMHNYMKEDLYFRRGSLWSRLGVFVWALGLRRHDKIIALSQHMAEYYRQYPFKLQSVDFVYNGRTPEKTTPVPVGEQRLLQSLKINYKLVGMVCGLNRRKGIDVAISLLPKSNAIALVVIGGGPERENLEALASSLGVRDRCYFLGPKPSPYAYFEFFDVYLLSSRSEGFPLALIEAAALNVPIVASDLPVLREVFTLEEVVLAEPDNPQSFLAAIKKVISNPVYYYKNAKLRQEAAYSASSMSSAYQKVYESL